VGKIEEDHKPGNPKRKENAREQSTNLEIFVSKPKFHIYSLLEMYGELSSQELEELIHKSKSSVNVHLQELVKRGIIAEPTTRDKKGNYIYHLSNDYEEKILDFGESFDFTEELTARQLTKIIEIEANGANIHKHNLQILFDFSKEITKESKFGLSEETVTLLQNMTNTLRDEKGNLIYDRYGVPKSHYEILNSYNYLSPLEYSIFRERWNEFLQGVKQSAQKVKESSHNDKSDKGKTMFIAVFGLPLKKMLGYIEKRKKITRKR